MTFELYRTLHFAGLFTALLALGGTIAIAVADAREHRSRRGLAAAHGVGLLVALIAGFGMLAKGGHAAFPWPAWAWVKLAVWLALGVLPMLALRRPRAGLLWWLATLLLALTAALMARHKPF